MSVIYGITSFYREVAARPADKQITQVVSVSQSFAKLALTGLLKKSYKQDLEISSKAKQGSEPKLTSAKKIVVVLPTAKEISVWSQYLEETLPNLDIPNVRAGIFPSYTCWGTDRFINPVQARRQRLMVLAMAKDKLEYNIILTTLPALLQKTLSVDEFSKATLKLIVDKEYDQDDLLKSFDDLGYQKTSKVEEEGHWAVRGGIIDVYPLNLDHPIRLEFFGDTLTSIRTFAPENQRSKEDLPAVVIAPACEALTFLDQRKKDTQKLYSTLLDQDLAQEDRDGIMSTFSQGFRFSGFDMFVPIFRDNPSLLSDYLPDNTDYFFPSSIEDCLRSLFEFSDGMETSWQRDKEAKRPTLSPGDHFLAKEKAKSQVIDKFHCFEFGNPYSIDENYQIRLESRSTVIGAPVAKTGDDDLFSKWISVFRQILKKGTGSLAVFLRTEEAVSRTKSLLAHNNIESDFSPTLFEDICTGIPIGPGVFLGKGHIGSHLWLDESELLLVSEDDLFGPKKSKRKAAPKRLRDYLSSFKDLKLNDLVVHLSHGIGRYLGMTTLEVAEMPADFLILEYAGKDKIYLPVDKLNLLQRYNGATSPGSSAQLDKLGGQGWVKRKSKVKKAIKDMADELLRIQAKRKLARPHVYSLPGETYAKFEEEFPYQETEDQLRVLEDVEADLTSDQLMDRLVVGDVGFGKTEIALRASLRAVLDGFQVLILVPTTILCYQHYQNFVQRLSKHGVEVRQINRFVKGKQLKETLAGLKSGVVDVVIGTHRLLSKDVEAKKLGLLVVDEEQRFGVTHKERIKEVRANADVLTLTATPIPRTLHMAMLGLRQISVIATPPSDRLAVKTYVSKFDEPLIKEAIEAELSRGGQVFFVHNRVENIQEIATFVKGLVPNIDVRTAHGQMGEVELEKTILDFVEQKFSVMVCTTIIESGIDMPNVNTIIINRADRFGLAQLYQLRGRVGRSSVQAYAYFFTPVSEKMSPESKKRLEVIVAHQELGSGFHIASHDLEIRGAGNLLGAEQSGQVMAVGIEMYTDMLDSVIKNLKGEKPKEKQEIEFKVNVSAIIPPDFVESESERLSIYKEMFSVESQEELSELRHSLKDRYGETPGELNRLFMVAEIKRALRALNAVSLAPGKLGRLELKFGSLFEQQIGKMIEIAAEQPEKYRLLPDYRMVLSVRLPLDQKTDSQDMMLRKIQDLLEPLLQKIVT